MGTARSLLYGGLCPLGLPGQRPTLTETSLDRDPLDRDPLDGDSLWTEISLWTETETPPCGQSDTCGNITFANFVCGR